MKWQLVELECNLTTHNSLRNIRTLYIARHNEQLCAIQRCIHPEDFSQQINTVVVIKSRHYIKFGTLCTNTTIITLFVIYVSETLSTKLKVQINYLEIFISFDNYLITAVRYNQFISYTQQKSKTHVCLFTGTQI